MYEEEYEGSYAGDLSTGSRAGYDETDYRTQLATIYELQGVDFEEDPRTLTEGDAHEILVNQHSAYEQKELAPG